MAGGRTLLAVCLVAALALSHAARPSAPSAKELEEHKRLAAQAEAMGGLKHKAKIGPEFQGMPGVDKAALQRMLELAELQFQNNLKRRATRMADSKAQSLSAGDYQSLFLEPTYSCPVQSRFGRWGDGGLWVCLSNFGSAKSGATALSFASGCDYSFEKELYETMGVRSHLYDFDLSSRSRDELNTQRFVTYHNGGLTGASKLDSKRYRFPSVNWVTLPTAIKDAGVEFADVVKIDCEGCEIDVVKDLAASSNRTHPAVGQILMQVHDVSEWKLPKIRAMLTTLEGLGFRLFSAEANAYYKQHYDVALVHESLVKPRDAAL